MDRIGAGEFPPGSALPSERDLMEAYGVGRPAVREALQSLERSGIISITHGERARVAIPSARGLVAQIASGAQHLLRIAPDSLEHLKEARVFLEAGLARLAAERAGDAGVAALRSLLEQQRRARGSCRATSWPQTWPSTARSLSMTGNPIFPAVVEAMFGWLGAHHRSLVARSWRGEPDSRRSTTVSSPPSRPAIPPRPRRRCATTSPVPMRSIVACCAGRRRRRRPHRDGGRRRAADLRHDGAIAGAPRAAGGCAALRAGRRRSAARHLVRRGGAARHRLPPARHGLGHAGRDDRRARGRGRHARLQRPLRKPHRDRRCHFCPRRTHRGQRRRHSGI